MTEPTTDPVNTETGNDPNLKPDVDPDLDSDAIKNGAIDSLLKDLGVNSTDDLKSIIEAKNKADKESRTDLENAKSELQKSKESNQTLVGQVKALEATNAVLKAGVVAEHIDDVTVLAQAKVNKGEAKTFDKAVKKVLDNNPQFKTVSQTGNDGTAIIDNNITPSPDSKKSNISDMIEKLNAGRITK